jgi:hypothetical protein
MAVMRHYFGTPEDFHYVVEAFPASLSELRAYLLGRFGIHVPASIPNVNFLWGALVDAKGEDRAADIVAELVVTKGGRRVLELIQAQANEEELFLRADDPDLAHVLFEHEDLYDELGDFMAGYWLRSRGPNARPGPPQPEAYASEPPPDPPGSEPEPVEEAEPLEILRQLRDRLTGRVTSYRPSAALNSGLGFERVSVTQRDFVVADPTWKEQDLENFLWEHWEHIDFGRAVRLVLFDRQVRINPNRLDRMDLLAQDEAKGWYAIELKIVPAKRRDLTQLLSYMSDLVQVGVPQQQVHGLLVAPDFDDKLINAAAIQPRVELLRFRFGESNTVGF